MTSRIRFNLARRPMVEPTVRSVHVSKAQLAELFNLYHLARTALSGRDDSPYQRMLWAAKEFAKANPAISETRAYKELSNARENGSYQGF